MKSLDARVRAKKISLRKKLRKNSSTLKTCDYVRRSGRSRLLVCCRRRTGSKRFRFSCSSRPSVHK